jgi:hypothetical protein
MNAITISIVAMLITAVIALCAPAAHDIRHEDGKLSARAETPTAQSRLVNGLWM